MGAKTAISVDEYLYTSFPGIDCEYRDGELVERSIPDYVHGHAQAVIASLFEPLRRKLPVYGCISTRMKLREGLYLIPDVAAFWPSAPAISVPDSPPLIAVEIVSPDDRLTAVREKLHEYHTWGVPHVWLVDPCSRRLYTCDSKLAEVNSFSVPELSLTLTPAEIFD